MVVSLFCYANTLLNDYCDDGIPVVRANQKVTEPGQWKAIWTTDYWSDTKDATPNRDLLYRPVALSSFRLVYQLFGADASPQLLLNMLLHAINSVLVVRLCRHMGGNDAAAIIAGALFAVLPIHTEVINNVVGRSDLLATLGVLAALLLHRRSTVATTDAGIVKWRVAAAIAVFVAMGAKESALTAVPVIILFDGFWYRRWRTSSRDRSWWHPRSFLRFGYLVVPACANLALRYFALEGHFHQTPALTKTVNVLVDAPWWQHLLGVMQLWGMYWAKTVWPQVLCVNYSINTIRLATDLFDFNVLVGLFVTLALVVASVVAWRRGYRAVAFLCGGIAVTYFPTSNLWVLIQVFFVERIWYLPSIFVCVLAGLAVMRVKWRPPALMIATVLVFAMTFRCWVRNAEWRDNYTLYAATYEVHRQAVGALRLHGNSLVQQSQVTRNPAERQRLLAEGIALLQQAIDIDLGFTDAQRSLGNAYLLAGRYKDALKHLQIANMQVPDHPGTVERLKYVSRLLTEQDEELSRLRQEASEHPDDVERALALVRRLRELARTEEALEVLQNADSRFAESAAWQTEYAVTLVYLDQVDEAIDRYRKAVALSPSNHALMVELAMLLLERRTGEDLSEAWKLATRAATLAPNDPIVLVCQAELLALDGDLQQAVQLYERAIKVLPPDSEKRRNFEERAAALGRTAHTEG